MTLEERVKESNRRHKKEVVITVTVLGVLFLIFLVFSVLTFDAMLDNLGVCGRYSCR